MMEHQNRRCLWEQIEEQEENIKDEFVSPIKELTYDEVTEPIEKNVASYELSEMDWAEYLTHFTYLVEGLKDYRDELSKKHSDIDQKICDILHYIELCETDDNEAADLVELLRVCRENRRDIKDELQRIFNFKFPYEYIDRYQEMLDRKEKVKSIYKQFLLSATPSTN